MSATTNLWCGNSVDIGRGVGTVRRQLSMEVIFMAAHILRDRVKGFYQEKWMAGFTLDRRQADRRTGVERRGPGSPALGGPAGRGIAEMLDPAGEEAYWRENYATQPYYQPGYTYDDYHP